MKPKLEVQSACKLNTEPLKNQESLGSQKIHENFNLNIFNLVYIRRKVLEA